MNYLHIDNQRVSNARGLW